MNTDNEALRWAGAYGYLQASIEIAQELLERGAEREAVAKLLSDNLATAERIRRGEEAAR